MRVSRRFWMTAAVAGPAAGAAAAWAMSRSNASQSSEVHEEIVADRRIITSNGVPEHPTGDFPNRQDPAPLRPQRHRFEMPSKPTLSDQPSPLNFWQFGIAINGVPFDPSGPYWNSDASSGWLFEVLSPAAAVALGIDVNRAHTQGPGMYHDHGLPSGLYWRLRHLAPGVPMHLLGFAADGFPIYGPEGPADPTDLDSPTRRLRPSYRIRQGRRPDGPRGRFDGTFVQDFEYVEGWGDLDECNGRAGPTPEFHDGTYYYVLTDEFPFIPRLYRGRPDPTFRHGPPPGTSPPVPPELRHDRAEG